MAEDAKAAAKRRLAEALRANLKRRKAGARPQLAKSEADRADTSADGGPGE